MVGIPKTPTSSANYNCGLPFGIEDVGSSGRHMFSMQRRSVVSEAKRRIVVAILLIKEKPANPYNRKDHSNYIY